MYHSRLDDVFLQAVAGALTAEISENGCSDLVVLVRYINSIVSTTPSPTQLLIL
jgi:hypothetical protein